VGTAAYEGRQEDHRRRDGETQPSTSHGVQAQVDPRDHDERHLEVAPAAASSNDLFSFESGVFAGTMDCGPSDRAQAAGRSPSSGRNKPNLVTGAVPTFLWEPACVRHHAQGVHQVAEILVDGALATVAGVPVLWLMPLACWFEVPSVHCDSLVAGGQGGRYPVFAVSTLTAQPVLK